MVLLHSYFRHEFIFLNLASYTSSRFLKKKILKLTLISIGLNFKRNF